MVAMVTSSWSKSQGISHCIEVSFHTCNYIYMFTRPITPPITQVIVGLNVDSGGATDLSGCVFSCGKWPETYQSLFVQRGLIQ